MERARERCGVGGGWPKLKTGRQARRNVTVAVQAETVWARSIIHPPFRYHQLIVDPIINFRTKIQIFFIDNSTLKLNNKYSTFINSHEIFQKS